MALQYNSVSICYNRKYFSFFGSMYAWLKDKDDQAQSVRGVSHTKMSH